MLRKLIHSTPHLHPHRLFSTARLRVPTDQVLKAQEEYFKNIPAKEREIKAYFSDASGSAGDPEGNAATHALVHSTQAVVGDSIPKEHILKPVRAFMGMGKRDHIFKILNHLCTLDPSLDKFYKDKSRLEYDVEHILRVFTTEGLDFIREFSTPLPGMPELVDELKRRGIPTILTTAYGEKEAAVFKETMKKHGVEFAHTITSYNVFNSRPYPFTVSRALDTIRKHPWQAIYGGDTLLDCESALLAQIRFIALVSHSAMLPMYADKPLAVARKELAKQFRDKGAHYINDADTAKQFVSNTLNAIKDANEKMLRGEFPYLTIKQEQPEEKMQMRKR